LVGARRRRMVVFIVQHVHKFDEGEENVKMIGVYSTQEQAERAVERLREQPGFRDVPTGFSIDPYIVDEDNWTEGYVTLYHGASGQAV
jgi:hypothetical protein